MKACMALYKGYVYCANADETNSRVEWFCNRIPISKGLCNSLVHVALGSSLIHLFDSKMNRYRTGVPSTELPQFHSLSQVFTWNVCSIAFVLTAFHAYVPCFEQDWISLNKNTSFVPDSTQFLIYMKPNEFGRIRFSSH